MADATSNKPSIFTKIKEASSAILDAQIAKAKSSVMNADLNEDFFYAKTITEDPSYQVYSAGWREKPGRLMDGHLRQMSIANSVVAAIIQTQQNQVANHSKLVKSEKEQGWMLCLRDEETLLEKIKEELKSKMGLSQTEGDVESELDVAKADDALDGNDLESDAASSDPNADAKQDDEVEEYNFELERKAREKLEQQFKDAKKKAQDYILNCGLTEDRPFESLKWNFDSALRAWTRDSLTYDKHCTEVVPDQASRPHHWFPVDAGTIKYASSRLKDYKELAENFINLDILYPEKQVEAMNKQKVLELKPELVEKNAYRYVQVVRGKIERAYTSDEMKMGIRNLTTDIYANGYGVSELELAVALITGHLNAEFYNQAYFTQGFSAKGILHIKAALNRRKVETVRQQWQHMLKGSRNSFQTPIFAGMEDVAWIPLTQNHNDIGFEGWMRYLIKMICAIYQIDPHEIGIGFKDEGGGGGLSGDNTREKLAQSKNKGLYPLLRHFENHINENILKMFDGRFILKFCGLNAESKDESVKRQDIERKYKLTLNEVRAQDGLPPLPGGDEIILGTEFMSWYTQFSPKALEKEQKLQDAQGAQESDPFDFADDENSMYHGDNFESNLISPEDADVPGEQPVKKSRSAKQKTKRVKVEYYRLKG